MSRLPQTPSRKAFPVRRSRRLTAAALLAGLCFLTGLPFARAQQTTAPPTSTPSRASRSTALKEPVRFSARDSLIVTFDDVAGDTGTLYGESHVAYGDVVLSAYGVTILFDRRELQAFGLPVDTGMVGRPRIQQGSETFSGRILAFNLQTERGRVVGAQTRIEDGFIRAGIAKVKEDSVIYIKDGAYTTCSCVDDPSYSLRSSKMKIVNKKWIYTGPLQLYLYNIPTPLWLPFGFLPAQSGRRSGPLPPQYGEDEFGFYLRGWGWYFALSDYMDLQLKGSLWTRGSWGINALYRYNKRYTYSGQLEVDFSRLRRGES
ncbi:MAG: LPS-assembly protein LptD, partial [Bacteroidetes bacterium]